MSFLPENDFKTFLDYVVNDESWKAQKRHLSPKDFDSFPFKLRELMKPCELRSKELKPSQYIDYIMVVAIQEYCINEYILLGDYFFSLVKKIRTNDN